MNDHQSTTTTITATGASVVAASVTGPDAATAEYRQAYRQLHTEAVDVLSRALTLPVPASSAERAGYSPYTARPLDFADFLAGVLAAVAANAGSIDRLTAGRPGSWEADLLEQLVSGTVGHNANDLVHYRTTPVVVPLNVLELADTVPGFPHLDENLDQALSGLSVVDRRAADQLTDAEWDAITTAENQVEAAVTAAHTTAYAAYADAFTTAVHAAAARIPGLDVPVTVDAIHDPAVPTQAAHRVTNPDPFAPDHDALVSRLWETAFAAVPTPTIPAVTVPTLPGTRQATDPTTSTGTSTSTGTPGRDG